MFTDRMARTALTAALLLAAAPTTAQAAWSTEEVPGTAGALPPAQVAVDGGGRAFTLFERFLQQATPQRSTQMALRAASGGWTLLGAVPGIGWGGAQPLAYGRSRVLLVTRQVTGYGRYHRARFRLVWAPGRTTGRFAAYRQIAASADVPSAAVDRAGEALVAFTAQRGSAVYVSERPRGGAFGAPRRLSGSIGNRPAVAINARGDRAVAWFGPKGLRARVRRAGHGWGPVQSVSRRPAGGSVTVRAAVAPNGRVVIAWADLDAVRDERPAPLHAAVAVRSLGGHWHARTLMHAVAGTPAQAYGLEPSAIPVADTSDRLLVAYTAVRPGGTGIVLAEVRPSAQIAGRFAVSGAAATATLDDLVAGPDERLAVTWAEHGPLGSAQTFVALRPPTGGFEAPANLTPPGLSGITGSRVAFSRTGAATVVLGYLTGGRTALAAAVSDPAGR